MSTIDMETNKWLWQPRPNGPIYLRVTYADESGRKRQFTRSLRTGNWSQARKIRDTEFTPIILDMEKARIQLELIRELYPELESQLQTGVHGGYGPTDGAANDAVKLATVVESWSKALSEKNGNHATSPGTAKRYSSVVRAFLEYKGPDADVRAIETSDVVAFRDLRLTELEKSKKTVNLELTCLRSFFRYACDRYGLDKNPGEVVSIRRTRAESVRQKRECKRRPPTHSEADSICTKFPPHSRIPIDDFQDYAMVARYTGMRQAEIAHLQGSDVCHVSGDLLAETVLELPEEYLQAYDGEAAPAGQILCLHVVYTTDRNTKTGSGRIVPVADKLMPVVKSRLATSPGDKPLFPIAADDGGAKFGRVWLKKVKKIHPDLTMHGFRHYATSEMENAGVGRGIACAVLGHEEKSVHGGYFHQTIAAMKGAVDKIY